MKKPKIVSTPDTCGGEPRIDGTRMTVKTVSAAYRRGGIETVLRSYPHLTKPQIAAVLDYEHDQKQRKIKVSTKTTVTTYSAPFTPNQAKALHEAVAAIYFSDNSDYESALWAVVRALSPEVAKVLEEDEESAYEQTRKAVED